MGGWVGAAEVWVGAAEVWVGAAEVWVGAAEVWVGAAEVWVVTAGSVISGARFLASTQVIAPQKLDGAAEPRP